LAPESSWIAKLFPTGNILSRNEKPPPNVPDETREETQWF
jgi:hypothetical protein